MGLSLRPQRQTKLLEKYTVRAVNTLGDDPVLLILLALLIQAVLALATGTPVSLSHTAIIVFPLGLVLF